MSSHIFRFVLKSFPMSKKPKTFDKEQFFKALADRTACLLANHGMLARGPTLLAAFETALKLEALARQYLLARSIGTPTLLTPEEWVTVQQLYRTYGKAQALDRQPRWQLP